MKSTRYTLQEFNTLFQDDAACLAFIWEARGSVTCRKCSRVDKFSPVSGRRSYACICGHQEYPTAGTIYHKSTTSLRSWFFAMFLMSASKNGVAALELQRQVGVTYKTAWRMAHQIRKLMQQGGSLLGGVVEADETYIGGKAGNMHKHKRAKLPPTGGHGKAVVLGVVERGGEVRAHVALIVNRVTVLPHTLQMVEKGAQIFTDEHSAYDLLTKAGFKHDRIAHGKGEYVRATVHTNSIENFWGQLKRSINGTFHHVSPQHLQAYVNEFAFRYNHRPKIHPSPIFPVILKRVAEQHT